MGWSFTDNTTREQIIKEQTAFYNGKDSTYNKNSDNYHVSECLKHVYKGMPFGGTLWKVVQKTLKRKSDDSVIQTMLFIGCDLLRYDNTDNRHSWGVKEMDETCGPNEVNFPESYINMVPLVDVGYAKNWRERVAEFHRIRKEKLAVKRGKINRPFLVS